MSDKLSMPELFELQRLRLAAETTEKLDVYGKYSDAWWRWGGAVVDELVERRQKESGQASALTTVVDKGLELKNAATRLAQALADVKAALPPVGRGDSVEVPRENYERARTAGDAALDEARKLGLLDK